jgi:hypothetical protein
MESLNARDIIARFPHRTTNEPGPAFLSHFCLRHVGKVGWWSADPTSPYIARPPLATSTPEARMLTARAHARVLLGFAALALVLGDGAQAQSTQAQSRPMTFMDATMRQAGSPHRARTASGCSTRFRRLTGRKRRQSDIYVVSMEQASLPQTADVHERQERGQPAVVA